MEGERKETFDTICIILSCRGNKILPSPTSYSDRCTEQAAISSSPETQSDGQMKKKKPRVDGWLPAKLAVNETIRRQNKRPFGRWKVGKTDRQGRG